MDLTGFPVASSSGPAPGSTVVTVTDFTADVDFTADAGSTADADLGIAAATGAEQLVVDSTDAQAADSAAESHTVDFMVTAADFTVVADSTAAAGSTVVAVGSTVVDTAAADTAVIDNQFGL
jgi:hypothetical protein